jgi:hypothetical protein
MTKEVSSCVTIDVSSDYDTFFICTSHYVFISYIVSFAWKFLDMKENLKILFNPFSGRFFIASHIYMGEFPLSPAGI